MTTLELSFAFVSRCVIVMDSFIKLRSLLRPIFVTLLLTANAVYSS